MTSPTQIVTLLTDFGQNDAYVASMKGVLLDINPKLRIIDISHEVPKFNVKRAAIVLAQASSFFPRRTIHVAVVDPGVGTLRKPLVMKTKNYFFVGPDNGVLSIAAEKDGILCVYRIEEGRYVFANRSCTFAGRDIFAPVAAHISRGVPLKKLGKEIGSIKRISICEPKRSGNMIDGEVLMIDSFGNIITNIGASLIRDMKIGQIILIKIGSKAIKAPFLKTYGDVERGKPLAIIGSYDLLEIGINQGNISRLLRDVKEGSKVRINL
ncbi:MAG: SAM hydrolase/SAM-dependent halogenase family protein [Thermoproteota archaeon]